MKHHTTLKKYLAGIAAIAIVALQFVPFQTAFAAQITTRSLTLIAGSGGNGGSMPGGVVKHLFTFSVPSSSSVGSVQLQYCTTAAGTCTMPIGVVTNTAATTLGSNTGAISGLTLVNTTAPNGSPYLTRTAAAVTPGSVTIQLNGVTNPSTANQTFFVRISTFASTDVTGSPIDTGTVTASTATPIVLTGTMPESLVFCTGATVGLNTGGVPDCTTATAGGISFNQLFSPTDTATATSQMAASTNAGAGYNITVNGPTLTSGSNTIAPMTTAGATIHGTGQFGLNLRANTAATASSFPGTSADLAPASNGTTYRGEPLAGYSTADSFKFNSGDSVADSASGGAGGTNAQIYTVSYIVNVPGSQPAGTYTTTLTYICTPTF